MKTLRYAKHFGTLVFLVMVSTQCVATASRREAQALTGKRRLVHAAICLDLDGGASAWAVSKRGKIRCKQEGFWDEFGISWFTRKCNIPDF